MNDVIESSDLFEGNVTAEIKKINAEMRETLVLAKALKGVQKNIATNPLDNSSNINQHKKDLAQAAKLENDFTAQKIRNSKLIAAQLSLEQKAEAAIAKEQEKSIGTINKLKKANSDLTKERNKLNLETKEGKNRLAEINKELDKNNAFIKLNSSALEKQRLDIGGYKEAILEATGTGKLFGGVFGEIGQKLRAVGEILTGLREQMVHHAEVTAANTEAVAANTVTEQASIATTEEKIAVEKLNSAALEANTIATEENTSVSESSLVLEKEQIATKEADVVVTNAETVSTEKLTLAKRAYNAVTSVTGLILIAAAAAAKLLYDNLHKTQSQKDEWEAYTEATEEAAKAIDLVGSSSADVFKRTHDLIIAEKALQDLRIKSIVTLQNLRTEGAKARTESEEEGKTTKDRIEALDLYIENVKKVGEAEIGLAKMELKLAQEKVNIKGERASREDIKALEEAKAEILKIEQEDANEERRSVKRRTGLIEKDQEDRLKMLNESKMREAELIKDEFKKETAIENQKYEQSLDKLKEEQEKSGFEDEHFQGERASLLALHLAKLAEIKEKAASEQDKKDKEILKRYDKLFEDALKLYKKDTDDFIKEQKRKWDESVKRADDNIKLIYDNNILAASLTKDLHDDELARFQKEIEDFKIQYDEKGKITEESLRHMDLLRQQHAKNDADIDKKESEKKKQTLKEQFDTAMDFAEQGAKKKAEIEEKRINDDLSMRQRNIEQQQQLAISGRANTLAFEKAAAAKDEKEKQDLAKKEEKREKAIAFLKLFAAYADKGEPDQALAKTLVQMAIAGAIAGSYIDGTENVGKDLQGNKMHSGKDGYVIAVDGEERIIKPEHNRMIGNMSNDELAKLAMDHQNGDLLPRYITDGNTGSFAQNATNSLLLHQVTALTSEIKEIKQALKDRPVHQSNRDHLGNEIDRKITNGIIKQTIKKSNSPLNYI